MFAGLRSLTLFGIAVEAPKDYFLPQVLNDMPLLQELRLPRCGISGQHLTALFDYLAQLSELHLKTLGLNLDYDKKVTSA